MSSLEMLLAAQPAAVFAEAEALEAAGRGCVAAAQQVVQCSPGGSWSGAAAESCTAVIESRAVRVQAQDGAFRNGAAAIRAYALVLQEQQQIAQAAVARRDAARTLAEQESARLRSAMAAGQWSAVPPLVSSIQAANRAYHEAVAAIRAAVMRVTQAATQLQGQLLGAGAEFDRDLVQVSGIGGESAWDSFARGVGETVMPEVRGLLAAGRDMWDNFWTLDPRVTPVDVGALLDPKIMPADQAIAPAAKQVSDWLALAAEDPARAGGQLTAGLALAFGTDGIAALRGGSLLDDLATVPGATSLDDLSRFPVHDDFFGNPVSVSDLKAGDHANQALRVDFEDGSRGIYKPQAGEDGGLRSSVPDGGMASREVAGYRLDSLLGFDLVPPTTRWDGPAGAGSLQRWIDDAGPSLDVGQYSLPDQHRMAALDYISGNTDRHLENYLTSSQGRPVAIDNGLSFPVDGTEPIRSDFIARYFDQPLAPEVVDQIRAVDPVRVEQELLTAGLDRPAVDGVVGRLQEIQQGGKISGTAWPGRFVDAFWNPVWAPYQPPPVVYQPPVVAYPPTLPPPSYTPTLPPPSYTPTLPPPSTAP